jgi:hypothetical protein
MASGHWETRYKTVINPSTGFSTRVAYRVWVADKTARPDEKQTADNKAKQAALIAAAKRRAALRADKFAKDLATKKQEDLLANYQKFTAGQRRKAVAALAANQRARMRSLGIIKDKQTAAANNDVRYGRPQGKPPVVPSPLQVKESTMARSAAQQRAAVQRRKTDAEAQRILGLSGRARVRGPGVADPGENWKSTAQGVKTAADAQAIEQYLANAALNARQGKINWPRLGQALDAYRAYQEQNANALAVGWVKIQKDILGTNEKKTATAAQLKKHNAAVDAYNSKGFQDILKEYNRLNEKGAQSITDSLSKITLEDRNYWKRQFRATLQRDKMRLAQTGSDHTLNSGVDTRDSRSENAILQEQLDILDGKRAALGQTVDHYEWKKDPVSSDARQDH